MLSIEETKNTRCMTINEFQSSLSVHEKKKSSSKEDDQAPNVKGRDR